MSTNHPHRTLPSLGELFNPYALFNGSVLPEILSSARIPGVRLPAKVVYSVLARYAAKSGIAYPALDTVAQQLALSERQVRKHIRTLEAAALLVVVRDDGSGSYYQFPWHAAFEAKSGAEHLFRSPRNSSSAELDNRISKNQDSDLDLPPASRKKHDSQVASIGDRYPQLRQTLTEAMSTPGETRAPRARFLSELVHACGVSEPAIVAVVKLKIASGYHATAPVRANRPLTWKWWKQTLRNHFASERHEMIESDPLKHYPKSEYRPEGLSDESGVTEVDAELTASGETF